MPNYQVDPDIRVILESRFEFPADLDSPEAERLERFLKQDQVLERFYRDNPPTARPPEDDLLAAATTAMTAYDQGSEKLPVVMARQSQTAVPPSNKKRWFGR